MRTLSQAPLVLLLLFAACSPSARPAPAAPDRALAPPPTTAPADRAPSTAEAAPEAPPLQPEAAPPSPDAPHSKPEAPPASAWSEAVPGQPRAPVRFSDADRTAVVRLLCEGKPVSPGKHGFQCACPSYAEMPYDYLTMDVGPFFPGHFTGPGRDDVVVVLSGCESGAGSSQTYASRAVVRREPEGWKIVFFGVGALGDCTSILSPGGRSRLVCHRTGGHQGYYPVSFDLVAFDEMSGHVEQQVQPILEFTTHLGGPCCASDPFYVLDVTRYAVLGKRAYEAGDERALSVDIGIRSSVRCEKDHKACEALADKATIDLSLRYTFDGAAFHLTPASRAAYERLRTRDRE